MWYSTFNKETWQLRTFRKQNLKFNQDDIGMYKIKFLTKWKEFIFRMARTEASLRGCLGFIGFGALPIVFLLKAKYYDPKYIHPKKKIDEENLKIIDAKAKEVLFYNNFGAPTRPHRNMDEMMAFLSGSETYDSLFEFIGYQVAADINRDQSMGLDGIMSAVDKDMLKKYRESMQNGGGHH